jgi:transmembrane protein EpsG
MSTIFDLEQTSYWLLLVWLFGGAVLLLGMPKKRELVCGRVQVRWYWTSAILLVLPYVLWSGYRTGGADTYPYMRAFQESTAVLSDIPKVMASDAKDPGFSALMILVKACGINDHQIFFLLVAAFQMWCILYTFRKYSSNFWISIFLFVASTDYMSWMQNGIRQFIAVCMTFAAFDWLIHKKYARFVIVVLIASQIHGSAIIMLPLAFIMQGKALNRQTMLIIVGAALCVPFIDRFTPVISDLMADTQYSEVMSNELWKSDNGTNIFRVIVYSVPALLALFGRRHISHSNDPVINQCINASIITMAIYLVSMVTSGIYVGRLPIYTTLHGYMTLPWIIDQIFEERPARLIKAIMIFCYLGFFYYQMHFVWGYL